MRRVGSEDEVLEEKIVGRLEGVRKDVNVLKAVLEGGSEQGGDREVPF